MYKKLLVVLGCLVFFLFNVFAQDTIPNGGFENWQTSGSGEDPVYWSSTNQLSSTGYPVIVFKSTDAHLGSYAVKAICTREFVPPPWSPNDTITVTGMLKYNDDVLKDYGSPFVGRPDSVKFWIKGTIGAFDAAVISFELTRWTDSTGSETVGDATHNMMSSLASYTEVTLPITYYLTDDPDTLIMDMAASFSGKVGNELYVDDMSFIYIGEIPVVLSSFTGDAIGSNIVLHWVTESEQDNLGFNIFMSENELGPFIKVNNTLIPGAGTTSQPQEYS